jgi:hypothetical protein
MNIFQRLFGKLRALLGIDKGEALDYSQIRSIYKYEIKNAILGYVIEGSDNPYKYAGQMKKSMSTAFGDAFEAGYQEGGGNVSDIEEADRSWLNNKKTTERGFIDQLFDRLKEMKKQSREDDQTQDEFLYEIDLEIEARSEGYAKTLDGIRDEGKLRGSRNIMLTFDGEDGQESCPECRKWKGKRHKASFWIKRGLVPGQPGNQNFSCRGYNCHHYLFDDKGEIWAGHFQ